MDAMSASPTMDAQLDAVARLKPPETPDVAWDTEVRFGRAPVARCPARRVESALCRCAQVDRALQQALALFSLAQAYLPAPVLSAHCACLADAADGRLTTAVLLRAMQRKRRSSAAGPLNSSVSQSNR